MDRQLINKEMKSSYSDKLHIVLRPSMKNNFLLFNNCSLAGTIYTSRRGHGSVLSLVSDTSSRRDISMYEVSCVDFLQI